MSRQVQVLDVACDGEHECMEDFGRRDRDEGTDVLEHVETHGVNAHNDDDRKRPCGVLRGGTSQWKEELAMLGWFSRLRVH